jgi:NAD(P)H-dependent FMN reductase
MGKRTTEQLEYVDVRDCLTTFSTKRHNEENGQNYVWYQTAMKSDGFIFVIPEYNRSYPGEWKILLDSLYNKVYTGKVAGLVGVSDGQFGGVRAIEHAILTLSNCGMYIMKKPLHFPFVKTQFDEKGELLLEDQKVRVNTFIDGFLETVSKFR